MEGHMRLHGIATALLLVCGFLATIYPQSAQGGAATTSRESPVDPALDTFISKIRAVDNHTHVNTISPDDSEYDALPWSGAAPPD